MPYGSTMSGGGLLPGAPAGGGGGLLGLGGGFNSPMTQVGLALLADDRGDPLRALGMGLRNSMMMRQMGHNQRMQQARWELDQRKWGAQQEQAAQQQRDAEAKRAATVQALVASGMDPAQAENIATAGAAGSFLKPQAAPSVPSSVQEAQWLLTASPEEKAAYERAQSLKRAQTNIYTGPQGGGLGVRPLTPEEGARFGIEDTSGLAVDERTGKVSALPESRQQRIAREAAEREASAAQAQAKADRERGEVLDSLQQSLDTYRTTLSETGTEFWGGGDKKRLEAARTDLLLEAKELARLGALSKPDMDLIEGMIADPTTIAANLGGIVTRGGNVQNYLGQLDVIQGKIDAARARLGGGAPQRQPTLQEQIPGQPAQPLSPEVQERMKKYLPDSALSVRG